MDEFTLASAVAYLKKKVTVVLIPAFFFMTLYFFLSGYIIQQIKADILPEGANLWAYGPLEVPLVKMQISLILTILTLVPIIAIMVLRRYGVKLWGLKQIIWLVSGVFLLLLGFSMTYFVLLPVAMAVLTQFALDAGVYANYSLYQFVLFIFITTVIFSIMFELPLVVIWLVVNNLVEPETLKEKRKYVFVGILILTALVTADPTPTSMLLLSVPMIILFELSLVIAKVLKKNKQRQD